MHALSRWIMAGSLLPLCLATPVVSSAQTFTVLVQFNRNNGGYPFAPVVQGIDGNFYGTTNGGQGPIAGTAYRLAPDGILTTLATLGMSEPSGGLVQDADGNLYGTTVYGGPGQTGRIYEVTPDGVLQQIFTFPSNGAHGATPIAGLIQATDGDLYGTTNSGGANNSGVIFKYTPGGAETVLYSFCTLPNCADGNSSSAKLVQANDGNFYGTTVGYRPVSGSCETNCGTVFRISPQGALTTLYSFCSQPDCADGANPLGELIQAADGSLYGTTSAGAIGDQRCADGCGTVFRITLAGAITTLHSFCSQPNCTDGAQPYAGLLQATDGRLYGTTEYGGVNDQGSIFRVTSTNSLKTMHSFCRQMHCPDGSHPFSALIQATDGNLYGTAEGNNGSVAQFGTVFKLSLGLAPFVKTLQAAGSPGALVTILGNNLTGATSVTFHGVPATGFTVNPTGSAITTTVPTGATTGRIQVTLANSTVLTSNVPFRVP